MTAGAPHGLVPMGLDALDMLRQEAGLIFAGQEFDDQTDPFEAGIGFAAWVCARLGGWTGYYGKLGSDRIRLSRLIRGHLGRRPTAA